MPDATSARTRSRNVRKRGHCLVSVQLHLTGELDQPVAGELPATGEETRVRLPELPVRGRKLRKLGGQVGAGMQLGVGEVSPDEPQVMITIEQRVDR